jgi:hypothetical protein
MLVTRAVQEHPHYGGGLWPRVSGRWHLVLAGGGVVGAGDPLYWVADAS